MSLAHGAGDGLDLGAETPEQLDEQTALALLAPMLADASV